MPIEKKRINIFPVSYYLSILSGEPVCLIEVCPFLPADNLYLAIGAIVTEAKEEDEDANWDLKQWTLLC